MLKRLKNLPHGLSGVRATGTVTKDDYDDVVRPLLAAAQDEGRRVRLLYEFAPAFKGFTAGAGVEDARLGLKYLQLFERCAIVSDRTWVRKASEAFAMLMPCPVKVFANNARQEALEWLQAGGRPTSPARPDDSDLHKGAVESDRPDGKRHASQDAPALGADGLPADPVAIAEDRIGANVDDGGEVAQASETGQSADTPRDEEKELV